MTITGHVIAPVGLAMSWWLHQLLQGDEDAWESAFQLVADELCQEWPSDLPTDELPDELL